MRKIKNVIMKDILMEQTISFNNLVQKGFISKL